MAHLLSEGWIGSATIGKQLVVGTSDVSGTYGIYSQLCFPSATGINATTIQFLIHGIGSERGYWNVATGYSYVDFAAEQGYTTFFFDRLGTGLSDHPDPIQTVQLPIQLENAHQLVHLLRNGGISNHVFKHVIGVGHSFGSFQVNGLTTKYPDDLDAAVLTGFSHDTSGFAIAFSGAGLAIASQSQPLHFAALSNGY
jgi:pimeloyl-ACP methyl ester carboxylesterase